MIKPRTFTFLEFCLLGVAQVVNKWATVKVTSAKKTYMTRLCLPSAGRLE
jgi:hypothetical protein